MTLNRLLTSLIQLVMLSVTIPLVIAMIKDIKNGGLND
jgi:hypothetical protein